MRRTAAMQILIYDRVCATAGAVPSLYAPSRCANYSQSLLLDLSRCLHARGEVVEDLDDEGSYKHLWLREKGGMVACEYTEVYGSMSGNHGHARVVMVNRITEEPTAAFESPDEGPTAALTSFTSPLLRARSRSGADVLDPDLKMRRTAATLILIYDRVCATAGAVPSLYAPSRCANYSQSLLLDLSRCLHARGEVVEDLDDEGSYKHLWLREKGGMVACEYTEVYGSMSGNHGHARVVMVNRITEPTSHVHRHELIQYWFTW
ncbi:hypothetical protein ACQ4PT_043775 [Festuca glaucescens]